MSTKLQHDPTHKGQSPNGIHQHPEWHAWLRMSHTCPKHLLIL